MIRRIVTLVLPLALICGGGGPTAGLARDGQTLDQLVHDLQVEESSNDATEELLKRGRTDPPVRTYLASKLPSLLEQYRENPPEVGENLVWGNEARLAGELKITEATAVLCKRIDMLTSPRRGGSLGYNFFDHEAVRALILMGRPVVPDLIQVLTLGNSLQRQEAVCALGYIGGDRAQQALKRRLELEADPDVRQRIEEALKQRPWVPKQQ